MNLTHPLAIPERCVFIVGEVLDTGLSDDYEIEQVTKQKIVERAPRDLLGSLCSVCFGLAIGRLSQKNKNHAITILAINKLFAQGPATLTTTTYGESAKLKPCPWARNILYTGSCT